MTGPGGDHHLWSGSPEVVTDAEQRVLAITPGDGQWVVELIAEEIAMQSVPGDPSMVRLWIETEDHQALGIDVPVCVLRRAQALIDEL